jgi:UDPglucose 6-dehydrogenase
MNISVLGTGYVGLTLSALLSRIGYKVNCVDVVPEKIDVIKGGKSYFFESGLDLLIKYGIESKNLFPTLDYKEGVKDADIIFMTIGTPSLEDGGLDLTSVYSAVEEASKYVKDGVIFVQRSTVPVGTGKRIQSIIRSTNPSLKFEYLSSPEFLREGSAVLDSLIQDRVVIGGESDEAKEKVFEIFEKLESEAVDITKDIPEIYEYANAYIQNNGKDIKKAFKEKCISTCLESAELIKVCSNTLLSTKISFANSIARVCDRVGANVNEVMDGVGMDKRISRSFLYAGLGFGGGCFPKDVRGLIKSIKDMGMDTQLFESVLNVNHNQIQYVIDCIKDMGILTGSKVGVLGLSFKPGTSDVRESPSCILCKELVKDGYSVVATDPRAVEQAKKSFPEEGSLKYVNTVEEVFDGVKLVILATEWGEYGDLDYTELSKKMKSKNMYDARNFLNKEKMSQIFNFRNLGS